MPKRKHRPPTRPDGKVECCVWCRRQLEAADSTSDCAATRDHNPPRSQGGVGTRWCCKRCNFIKADLTPEQWQVFMAANPRWWKLPISIKERAAVMAARGEAEA